MAWAQVPAIAVLPFKDLSGAGKAVGEAIAETVTADLKEVPGLRVIERSAIDRILAEQDLQAARASLDAAKTVAVGRLLGATMIVTGAYQRAAADLRLTARVIRVETGEILGTAKIDGPAREFLKLQDRITVELLRSAGPAIDPGLRRKIAQRTRPKLKSLRVVELYGDAVVQPDAHKKEELLRMAVAEDAQFEYAARDLEALVTRLKSYDRVARAADDEYVTRLRRGFRAEPDAAKVDKILDELFKDLLKQRRFRRAIVEARAILADPPKMDPGSNIPEMMQYLIALSYYKLYDEGAFLREGEKFVAAYPASYNRREIRELLDRAVERKRRAAAGAPKAEAEIRRLKDADPCEEGRIYRELDQLSAARDRFEACLRQDPRRAGTALHELAFLTIQQGDFSACARYLDQLKTVDPALYDLSRGLQKDFPVDE